MVSYSEREGRAGKKPGGLIGAEVTNTMHSTILPPLDSYKELRTQSKEISYNYIVQHVFRFIKTIGCDLKEVWLLFLTLDQPPRGAGDWLTF